MISKIVLFITTFIIWCFFSWPVTAERLCLGVFVSLLVFFMTKDMFLSEKISMASNFKRVLWFCYYIVIFCVECIKANIDVAYRVVHPDILIKPGMVAVKTVLRSDTALAFLANSITLTPGTTTVDIDKEKGLLYIHWIYVKSEDRDVATKLIVGRFERILKEIFE